MLRMVLTSPPTAEPLTAAEARARVNISASEMSDDTLNSLIKAARQEFDGWSGRLGRALITQTWLMYLPTFCRRIEIPLLPFKSVESVKYLDDDGAEQTVDPSIYRTLAGGIPAVELAYNQVWPQHRSQDDAVRVSFVVGYGADGPSVPEPIRSAIALRVSGLRSLSAQNLFVSEDAVEGVGSKRYIVGGDSGKAIDNAINSLISNYEVPRI